MRIDHVCYAAGPEGMREAASQLAERLQVDAHEGGVHPRFGTRNMVLPLAGERYVEVVEVLDHPASDKAPFGQAVRARSMQGGGWVAWVVAVDDLTDIEERLGRESVPGNRHTPEGFNLTWHQIGVKSLMDDPQLPFFVRWDSTDHHPSGLGSSGVNLSGLEISGDWSRVRHWLALEESREWWERDINFDFVAGDQHALRSVTFCTAEGTVTI